jgi:hypothetical protein
MKYKPGGKKYSDYWGAIIVISIGVLLVYLSASALGNI